MQNKRQYTSVLLVTCIVSGTIESDVLLYDNTSSFKYQLMTQASLLDYVLHCCSLVLYK